MSRPVIPETRCATCVCFCLPNRDDDINSDVGTCISRRYPSNGRKPAKRASDAACSAYRYWSGKEQQTGSGDGA